MKRKFFLLILITGMIFFAGCKSSDEAENKMDVSGEWELTVTVREAVFTNQTTFDGTASGGTVKSEGFLPGSYTIIDGNKITWNWKNDWFYEDFNGNVHSSSSMSGTATIRELSTNETAEATWSARKL